MRLKLLPNFTRHYLVTHTNYTRLTLLDYSYNFFSRFSGNVFIAVIFACMLLQSFAFFFFFFFSHHLHISRNVCALMRYLTQFFAKSNHLSIALFSVVSNGNMTLNFDATRLVQKISRHFFVQSGVKRKPRFPALCDSYT